MSADSLFDEYRMSATIAQTYAAIHELNHCHIDLTESERKILDIDNETLEHIAIQGGLKRPTEYEALEKRVYELRECLWLVRILKNNKWPVLLICGANHGPRMQYLAGTVGKYAKLEVNDYEGPHQSNAEKKKKRELFLAFDRRLNS